MNKEIFRGLQVIFYCKGVTEYSTILRCINKFKEEWWHEQC